MVTRIYKLFLFITFFIFSLTSLHATIWDAYYKIVDLSPKELEILLEKGEISPEDLLVEENNSILPMLIDRGKTEIAKIFILHGADVNIPCNCSTGGRSREGDLQVVYNQEIALCNAAENGDIPLMQFLLDHGARTDLSVHSSEDYPLIHKLIVYNHFDAVKFLIEYGKVNIATIPKIFRKELLKQALENKVKQLLEDLLAVDYKQDINSLFNKMDSYSHPFQRAIQDNDIEMINFLFDVGLDPNVTINGYPLIIDLVDMGYMVDVLDPADNAFKVFLKHKKTNINATCEDGFNVFFYAVSAEKFELAKLLLKYGAEPRLDFVKQEMSKAFKAYPSYANYTARFEANLRIALSYYHAEQEAEKILEINADFPEYDSKGFPFIGYAAISGNNALLKQLIDNGFDIDNTDKNGNTALLLAMINGQRKSAEILLENEADASVTNNLGFGAFYYFSSSFHERKIDMNFINLLIKRGADPLAKTRDGTVLHAILLRGHEINFSLIKFLLELGVNIDFLNERYRSAVDRLFSGNPDDKISDLILKYTKDPIYDLVTKKLKGYSVQNFRKDDSTIYIGIATTERYYSNSAFEMGRAMMDKHADVQVRIFTPGMITDEFIQQFDGLITPGGADNYPKQEEFTIADFDPNNMIEIEKLYQKVDALADKYSIPLVGMCAGNQHIALYHKATLKPIKNYDGGNHKGTFIKGSIPHFISFTPREQRDALSKCYLPEVTIPIDTAHHYVAVREKLGERLKLGVESEEGVVQSVYNGAQFIGFQFHPEHFYIGDTDKNPNRNRLLWENFIQLCKQHRRYLIFAQKQGLNTEEVMKVKHKQNALIIERLENCAKEEQQYDEYLDNDEQQFNNEELCSEDKFQWSDYDNFNYQDIEIVTSTTNHTCPQ